MPRALKILILAIALFTQAAQAEHVIVCGGPALRAWENYRVPDDQHDRWWANFVRASTLRMAELRLAYGKDAALVWLVYKPSYEARGREDGKPYTTWIAEQASKRSATLIWFNSTGDFISKINSRPRGSVETFDYFGHSNKYAFLFDYSADIMAASTAWLHERDLPRLKSSIFSRNAYCKSWGCHTGSSMSGVWKKHLGTSLEGAKGKTVYTEVGHGKMPIGYGGWTR
ncbi:hypothetical protein ACFSSA_09595 [Luteolibacter algae]|uniref:Uncharacterized protein n=1 Tax=Luteolibacter algae TaxID=454151 RepID=A0ABW5D922_9BACT